MTKKTEVEIVEPPLPQLAQPLDLNEAKSRLKENRGEIAALAKRTGETFYATGMLCVYVKAEVGHGNFMARRAAIITAMGPRDNREICFILIYRFQSVRSVSGQQNQ